MRSISLFILVIGFLKPIYAQHLTAEELLNKTIQHHDPNSLWDDFKASFYVAMETPKRLLRTSEISIDLKQSFFDLCVQVGENQWAASLKDGECHLSFNGSKEISPEIEKEFKLNCERAEMYKDYYTYLYGLPMKLRDPGTLIDPKVVQKTKNGTDYWVLKVTYEPEVGSDTWYFYFDQSSYALKQYQFFHEESKNDGEYIILEDEINIAGIKMPKNRSWYYNSDDTFLGKDILTNKKQIE